SGIQAGSTGYRWIIDPIDGTRSFVRGIPLWATLVGLEYQGELIAGVVCEPAFDNTYRALRGTGAYKNDQQIHVSTINQLSDAILCTAHFTYFKEHNKVAAFLALSTQAQRQRGYG